MLNSYAIFDFQSNFESNFKTCCLEKCIKIINFYFRQYLYLQLRVFLFPPFSQILFFLKKMDLFFLWSPLLSGVIDLKILKALSPFGTGE